jgi:hypothetical protein
LAEDMMWLSNGWLKKFGLLVKNFGNNGGTIG